MQEAVTQLSKVSELFILTALSFCFLPFMSHTVQHINNTTTHRYPLRANTKNIQHVFVTTFLQKEVRKTHIPDLIHATMLTIHIYPIRRIQTRVP